MKFERGQDPKEAMGIGIFTYRSFPNEKAAIKFIFDNFDIITNTSINRAKYFKKVQGNSDLHNKYSYEIQVVRPIVKYAKKHMSIKQKWASGTIDLNTGVWFDNYEKYFKKFIESELDARI